MGRTYFLKIVYWGRIWTGKTRSLELWKQRSESKEGYLDPSWISQEDHTFFLNFLPLEWTLSDGSLLVAHLYEAPGGTSLYPKQLGVLELVDGIIFCINREHFESFNIDLESRWNLNQGLRALGYNRNKFQIVLQDVTPVEAPNQISKELARVKLRLGNAPWFEVNLETGDGLEKPLYELFSKLIPKWSEQGIKGPRVSYPRFLKWEELFSFWEKNQIVYKSDLEEFIPVNSKLFLEAFSQFGTLTSFEEPENSEAMPGFTRFLGAPSRHPQFYEKLARAGSFSFSGLLRELSFQGCCPWVDPIYYQRWLKDFTLVDLLPGQLPKQYAEDKLIFPLCQTKDRLMALTCQPFLFDPDQPSEDPEQDLSQRLNMQIFRVLTYPWRIESLIKECYEPILKKHQPYLVPKEPLVSYHEVMDDDMNKLFSDIDNLFSEDRED